MIQLHNLIPGVLVAGKSADSGKLEYVIKIISVDDTTVEYFFVFDAQSPTIKLNHRYSDGLTSFLTANDGEEVISEEQLVELLLQQ